MRARGHSHIPGRHGNPHGSGRREPQLRLQRQSGPTTQLEPVMGDHPGRPQHRQRTRPLPPRPRLLLAQRNVAHPPSVRQPAHRCNVNDHFLPCLQDHQQRSTQHVNRPDRRLPLDRAGMLLRLQRRSTARHPAPKDNLDPAPKDNDAGTAEQGRTGPSATIRGPVARHRPAARLRRADASSSHTPLPPGRTLTPSARQPTGHRLWRSDLPSAPHCLAVLGPVRSLGATVARGHGCVACMRDDLRRPCRRDD